MISRMRCSLRYVARCGISARPRKRRRHHPRSRSLYSTHCAIQVRISPGEDGLAVIRSAAADAAHPAHDAAKALLTDVTRSPEWLDRAAVARGQQAFVRYGFGSLSMLFFFSLVGGFGAPRINKGTRPCQCCV